MVQRRLLIEVRRITFHNAEGARRANPNAKTCAVAKLVPNHSRLPVYQLDGTLGTRGNTKPATVAQLLIDLNDFPNGHNLNLLGICWIHYDRGCSRPLRLLSQKKLSTTSSS